MYESRLDLILASASPRRRELLSRLGIKFSVMPSNLEEDGVISCQEQEPKLYVQNCARAKVEKIVELVSEKKDFWFLGVDTVVVIDGLILGKPKDKEQAKEFLQRLSGRWHQVISGYHLFHPASRKRLSNIVESRVLIKRLTEPEISAYISTSEPYDKAGGYAAQGIGASLIQAIEGSYTNVVGLPLAEVVNDLLRLGIIVPASGRE